jgi:uncharacterized protein YbjQ (UPF0145 family)
MGFLNRGGAKESREERERRGQLREADVARIAAGGIPAAAEERLRTLGAEAGQAFTSDLSVPEFVLARRHRLEPLTQVMGSSVYHVGWQYLNQGIWGSTIQELTVLADAYNDCRVRALARLRQEAELAGADAVVGVRVTAARYEWGSDLVEFRAIGTAVRAPELRRGAGPALTNLTGQDVALLLDGGYAPLGVVGATSVFYGQLWTWGQSMPFGRGGGFWSIGNVEFGGATQTWYTARHAVLERLRAEAAALGAAGIIGTDWGQEERPYEQNDRVSGVTYTIHALATAIAGSGRALPEPATTISL